MEVKARQELGQWRIWVYYCSSWYDNAFSLFHSDFTHFLCLYFPSLFWWPVPLSCCTSNMAHVPVFCSIYLSLILIYYLLVLDSNKVKSNIYFLFVVIVLRSLRCSKIIDAWLAFSLMWRFSYICWTNMVTKIIQIQLAIGLAIKPISHCYALLTHISAAA